MPFSPSGSGEWHPISSEISQENPTFAVMICLPSFLPLIRVGERDVAHYEACWLEEALRRAAREAGHEAWWPAPDVVRGVFEFLRDRFQKNFITLQDLFQKIEHTLRSIGFSDIAGKLKAEPPPVELNLFDLARESGTAFELAFYQRLTREVEVLREAGVTRFRCVQLGDSARWLAGCRITTDRSLEIEEEILDFLNMALLKAGASHTAHLVVS